MLHGRTIYRDIWFDKPPLTPAVYLLWGARAGWPLRAAGALYALLACWIIYRFARDLLGELSAQWAAALLAFFLIFDLPSGVIPLASDLLMLTPHIAAVWIAAGFAVTSAAVLAWFWGSGALGGYWEQVWQWGRLYAGSTFIEHPLRNGAIRTLNWAGFHATAVLASAIFWAGPQAKERRL